MPYWVLNGDGQPVPATVEAFGKMMEERTHVVAKDELSDDLFVSTVMLGIDHSFGMGGPPLLFETMTFGGELDEYQERYSTRAEALVGHAKAVAAAKAVMLARAVASRCPPPRERKPHDHPLTRSPRSRQPSRWARHRHFAQRRHHAYRLRRDGQSGENRRHPE